jgi:hypothetical protein
LWEEFVRIVHLSLINTSRLNELHSTSIPQIICGGSEEKST